MNALVEQHPGLVTALLATCIIMAGAIVIGAILLGRSIKVDVMGVHAELKPNGGESFRDIVDQRFNAIEGRLEKLETTPAPPVATAIVVTPPPAPEAA